MKIASVRKTLESLIAERLAALGATNIPTPARHLIEADVWVLVAALIHRHISGPVVGRAVARALAAPAATEQGREGGTPSPSSAGRTPSAQPGVAGPTTETGLSQSATLDL